MQKNKMARLLWKFLKRAQEKQSEPLSKPCAITIYGKGAAPLSKPHDNTFKAAGRKKRVTFWS